MNEQLRKGIVFSTLPIALIWAYFNLFGKSQPTTPSAASDPALATVTPLTNPAAPAQTADTSIINRLKRQPWGSDPFRGHAAYHAPVSTRVSAVATTSNTLSFVLSGIMYNDQNPVAYVNGQPVKIGQRINSAKVISIERRAVILDIDGRRLTLSLSKDARS